MIMAGQMPPKDAMPPKGPHGPGPKGPRGPRPKVENPGKLLSRLMRYVFKDYKYHCVCVFFLILAGVIANVQGTMFTNITLPARISSGSLF